MNRFNRQIAKFKKRTADENDVGVLLHDFNEADNLLSKLIEYTSAWRDGWSAILNYQERTVGEFESLYAPIPGNSSSLQSNTPSPDTATSRTSRLHDDYVQLRQDLLAELNAVDDTIIRPAAAAKDYIAPMKKTIKKRQDRKLDYEHYQSKYDGYAKKAKRSDRDNANMAKTEQDLANARDMYNRADDVLCERLPQILGAIYSLLPPIVAAQIRLQNTMLAHYYTVLHTFAEDHQFMSPPPPMEQIILEWEKSYIPVRDEVEDFRCLANGKARQGNTSTAGTNNQNNNNHLRAPPPNETDYPSPQRNDSTRSPSPASNYAPTIFSKPRTSIDTTYTLPQPPDSPDYTTKPRISRRPSITPSFTTPQYDNPAPAVLAPKPLLSPDSASTSTLSTTTPYYTPKTSPSPALSSKPSTFTLNNTTPMSTGFSPAGPKADYFTTPLHTRQAPTPTSTYTPPTSTNSIDQRISSLGAAAAAAAGKKRPPPPPKPKPMLQFVTALYDFQGQGEGDLVFYEGDRIRVLEKTGSTSDWWQGELRGVKGYFPANYVE